jgi:hypothetical protein
MVNMQRYFLLLLFALFCVAQTAAAQIRVTSVVTPTTGTLADDYFFEVTIHGTSNDLYPTLKDGEDFKLTLIGPKKSVHIQGGTVIQQISYNYRLIPTKTGLLKTPLAEVEIDGKTLTAPPIEVSVNPAPAGSQGIKSDEPFILKQIVSKKTVYRGEQLVNSIDLYSKYEISRASFDDLEYPQFLHQQIGKEISSSRIIEGQKYNLNRIRKALFPLSSGIISLPSRVIRGTARVPQSGGRSRFGQLDPFSGIFGAPVKRFNVASNVLEIEVLDLPPYPKDFPTAGLSTPIVGSLSVTAHSDNTEMDAGQGRTITVSLKSNGNLDGVKTIPLRLPPTVKSYPEEPTLTQSEEAGQLITIKSFRLSLVPTAGGYFEIGPIELGYFDPKSKSYRIASAPAIELNVKGKLAAQQPVQPVAPIQSQQPLQPSQQLTPPIEQKTVLKYQEETLLERISRSISLSLSILISTTLLILAFISWFIFQLRRAQSPKRSALEKLSQSPDLSALRDETFVFLRNFLLGESEDVTRIRIRQALANRNTASDVRFKLETLLDELDRSVFGKESPSAERTLQLKEKAISVLKDIA